MSFRNDDWTAAPTSFPADARGVAGDPLREEVWALVSVSQDFARRRRCEPPRRTRPA